jgi:hypothetical protein
MHKDALSLAEMGRWSVHHHHIAAVEFFFIIKESFTATQHGF